MGLTPAVVAGLMACGGGDTSAPAAAELHVVAGASQAAHAGAALPMPVVVRVEDPATGVHSGVHLRPRLTRGGSVSPSEAVTDANGEATFIWTLADSAGTQQLIVEDLSTQLRVTVTATALAPTLPVATQLAIATQPAGAVVGYFFTTQPVVELRDASGALVTGSAAFVTATVSGGFALGGLTSVRAVDGVARFSNLWLSVAGGDVATLTFTSLGVVGATSASFAVAPPELLLQNVRSPSGASDGAIFITQPSVQVVLNAGPVSYTSTASVTASVASGTGTLSGTTTVDAVNGVANFTDLRITGTGPHTLRFSSPGVGGTTSQTFVVSSAPLRYALDVGEATPMSVQAGKSIVVPIVLDLSGAPGGDVASLSFNLSWDASKFSFVSRTGNPTSGFSLFDNTTDAATGMLIVAGFAVPTATTSRTLYSIELVAKAGAENSSSSISVVVTAGGDGAGNRITITPRNLTVNITP